MSDHPRFSVAEYLDLADRLPAELVVRLRHAIDAAGGQTRVARATGVPLRTIQNWVAGARVPKAPDLAVLALACEVSLDWLVLGRTSSGGASASGVGIDTVVVPLLAAKAGGGGEFDLEAVRDQVPVSLRWLDACKVAASAARLVEMSGRQMGPALPDRSMVLVDISDRDLVRRAGVFAIVFRGAFVVRRIEHRQTGDVVMSSDDPTSGPLVLPPGTLPEIDVLGRVRGALTVGL